MQCGDAPWPEEQLLRKRPSPDVSGGQTCESGRERLSLDSSRRCRGGAGGSSRCEATECEERGPQGEGSSGTAAGTGRQLPAASSLSSRRNSRGRSNSCRIRQLEDGKAELVSLWQPKAQPGLSFPGERRAGARAERSPARSSKPQLPHPARGCRCLGGKPEGFFWRLHIAREKASSSRNCIRARLKRSLSDSD